MKTDEELNEEISELKLEVVLFQGEKLLVSKTMMVRLLLAHDVLMALREEKRIEPHAPAR